MTERERERKRQSETIRDSKRDEREQKEQDTWSR